MEIVLRIFFFHVSKNIKSSNRQPQQGNGCTSCSEPEVIFLGRKHGCISMKVC